MSDMHEIAYRVMTRDYPEAKAKLGALHDRVRLACATLRDAVGSNGPESIESFAERAAARIAELEAQLHDLTRARGDGWQLVHCDELGALRASREFACLTPDEDCECAGCMAAAEYERETT